MCSFCEPNKFIAIKKEHSNIIKFSPTKSKMRMEGNKIIMEFLLENIEYEATMIINYCPQCGRSLSDEKEEGKTD